MRLLQAKGKLGLVTVRGFAFLELDVCSAACSLVSTWIERSGKFASLTELRCCVASFGVETLTSIQECGREYSLA